MIVMGIVFGAVTLLLLGLAVAAWCATRAVAEDLGLQTDEAGQERVRLLPAGHQPPPGLSPLSPSERFLAAEASRGLRDLETFLAGAA